MGVSRSSGGFSTITKACQHTVPSIHHELRKIPALQTLQGNSASPPHTFLSVALEWPLTPYPY